MRSAWRVSSLSKFVPNTFERRWETGFRDWVADTARLSDWLDSGLADVLGRRGELVALAMEDDR